MIRMLSGLVPVVIGLILARCGGEEGDGNEAPPMDEQTPDYDQLVSEYRSRCDSAPESLLSAGTCPDAVLGYGEITVGPFADLYIPPSAQDLQSLNYYGECQIDCSWAARFQKDDPLESFCTYRLTTQGYYTLSRIENLTEPEDDKRHICAR